MQETQPGFSVLSTQHCSLYHSALTVNFSITIINLKPITFHQLRHTSASLQIALGLNPKLISNRLGHSSTSTTLNVYSHIFKSVENEAIDKLETIFSHTM